MTPRIAVGVSGTGTNLEALLVATERRELGGEIAFVFGDRPCPALDRAAAKGIPASITPDDAAILTALAEARVDLVVLAGYMRILGPEVTSAYPRRIVNTHPSLLPAFPGAHGVKDAVEHGSKVSGLTIHVVDASLDGGPVILQKAVPVKDDDTEETLAARILEWEHRLYPLAVRLVAEGRVAIEGRRTRIDWRGIDRPTVP